jgi:hypothetical protein
VCYYDKLTQYRAPWALGYHCSHHTQVLFTACRRRGCSPSLGPVESNSSALSALKRPSKHGGRGLRPPFALLAVLHEVFAPHIERKGKAAAGSTGDDDGLFEDVDFDDMEGTQDAARRFSPRLARLKRTAEEAKKRARDAIAAASSAEMEANARRARATQRAMDNAAA